VSSRLPSGIAAHSGNAAGTSGQQRARRLVAGLLIVTGLATLLYTTICLYGATQLVYAPQLPITKTPAAYGLSFQDVSFPSRIDHVQLQGWYIPGVLPDGQLTTARTIIMVHGTRRNRADSAAGLLDLSGALARRGFAILAFDMRGMGESPPAPISFGAFEQRDVLGAVDYLRGGPVPYPDLGRPRTIGGWGVSMGASTLLLAAAEEPAIQAVVSDCAYADILPELQKLIPTQGGIPGMFTPGILAMANVLYGINFYDVRPVDVVARLAPRPLLLIHGSADTYVPPINQDELFAAASAPPNAHVEYWRVPGAAHAQSFHKEGAVYVNEVVAFFDRALGPAA
jgi:fermentation-respiration switch protein FrsA (DUF1100 family)